MNNYELISPLTENQCFIPMLDGFLIANNMSAFLVMDSFFVGRSRIVVSETNSGSSVE